MGMPQRGLTPSKVAHLFHLAPTLQILTPQIYLLPSKQMVMAFLVQTRNIVRYQGRNFGCMRALQGMSQVRSVNPTPCNLQKRSHTFWRFAIQIPLSAQQMRIGYQLNNGQELAFWVPGRNENMRFAAHSVSTSQYIKHLSIDHLQV